MSIATEIARLRTAKTNIISSLEDKGVTVPANTTYSGISALIDSIPEPSSDVITGSMTYTTKSEYDRELGYTTTLWYVTLTFTDAIKGKGGRALLCSTYLNEPDTYGNTNHYTYYIYFDASGGVTGFYSTYMGRREVTVTSATWNATGDTVVMRCRPDNTGYLDYTPTAIWFAETF